MKIQAMIKKMAAMCLVALLCLTTVTGCGTNTKIVITTGLSGSQMFKIGSSVCTRSEIMVYLTTFYRQFASAYGTEMWNYDFGGTSLEDHVKDIVLSKMVQIKIMNMMAADRKLSLSEEEEEMAVAATDKYYQALSESLKREEKITREVVLKVYREYMLAVKVYRSITQSAEIEISDDEARTVTAQVLYLKNWKMKNDEKVPMSETELKKVENTARKVLSQIREGGDFEELALQYSDTKQIRNSYARGSVDPAFEELLFSLNTGEISDVVALEDGYYIVKCISTMDYEATQQNKLMLARKKKEEAFEQAYEEVAVDAPEQFQKKQWAKLRLKEEIHYTDADFFEIYHEMIRQ